MYKFLLLIALMITTTRLHAQSATSIYNKTLADSLGADEYGMKQYTLVILKTGPHQVINKPQRDSLFAGHLQNIGRLAQLGKLVVAGPLAANDSHYEGIFIFNVKTKQEAQSLLTTDPAISAGLLGADIYEWYGSAALPLYLPYHDQVQKTPF